MNVINFGFVRKLTSFFQMLLVFLIILSLIPLIQTAKAEDLPDLIIESITLDPASPKTGDTVTYTVSYKNQGQLSAGSSFYVCLYVDDKLIKDNSVGDLASGSSSTTTFTSTIGRDLAGGDHSAIAYVDMRNKDSYYARIIESSESNNQFSKTFQITKQEPDLIIESITLDPASPKTGDTVTYTVSYKNQGQLSAGSSFYVCLYVDDKLIKDNSVGDLASGSSSTTTFTSTIGRDLAGGDHSAIAYVDMRNKDSYYARITESSESNNQFSKTFQITKQEPDLIIESITLDPASPKTGDTVTYTVSYKNQGQLSAGSSFYVCLYVDDKLIKDNSVGDLASGSSSTTTFTSTIGRDLAGGDHSAIAYVDMRNKDSYYARITESSESNNQFSKTFQITKQEPDLIIESITLDPASPKTGDTVTYTVSYKNQGQLSAGSSFYVCLYVDDKLIKDNSVGDLASGSSSTTTFTSTIGRDLAGGDHSAIAYVDMRNKDSYYARITESSESNNQFSKTFQITKQEPDLIIESITLDPASPKTGDTVTYTVSYKNQGQLSAGSSFYVCMYVDDKLIKDNSVGDLASGSSSTTTFTSTIGRDLASGDHSAIAYVDMRNKDSYYARIIESSESNNQFSKTFPIINMQPDLIIENITLDPANPKTGDTVTYTVNYKNQGSLSAGSSFYVCLYVDEKLIKDKSVTDLASGASSSTTFTSTIGRDMGSGNHNVVAYVDMRNKDSNSARIAESSETNNKKDVVFSVEKIYSYASLIVTVQDSRNSAALENAEVRLNGELIGKTSSNGVLMAEIIEGENYVLGVNRSDYDSSVQTFNLGYDVEKKEIKVSLKYAKVPVLIRVKDEKNQPISNAKIYFDDNDVGVTDIDGEITGEAKKNSNVMLKVTKDGYYEENSLIQIGTSKSTQLVKLKLEDKTIPNIIIDKIEIIGDDDEILEEGESLKMIYTVTDNSGVTKITCDLDGVEIDSYSSKGTYSTITPNLKIGNHNIHFEAVDDDVNAHKASKDFPISVSKKGPNVVFKTTKNNIGIGENAVFTLGVLNPIGNPTMDVQLILETSDGVSVSGSSFAKSGAGMYTASYNIEPGDDMKYMTFNVQGNEVGTYKIKSEVHYHIPGEDTVVQKKEISLQVNDGKLRSTDKDIGSLMNVTSNPIPGFSGIFTLFGFLLAILSKKKEM
ncbi:CARDB domain-containing protein [Methanolobus sediminis]|uniref:CARDB domain-containing protein n=1 Tax=Methanolobus sediminis TaxID=3072978 RepID=A0AA51YMA8_9EURY|nr:CARDB domain-containing protein [Methanolobus sediminis]WMW25737.1 CARDB domain-containing protein [Methanolobus sediminis]